MKIFLDPLFVEKFPEYSMVTVIGLGINNKSKHTQFEKMLRQAEQSIKEDQTLKNDVTKHPKIASWRDAFRKAGIKPSEYRPSVDALIRRVLKEYETPYINSIVALSNYISLKYITPCGTYDLDKVEGKFGVKIAKGNENFRPIDSNAREHPEKGEIIYADEKKVMCRRWVWKQGDNTKVSTKSKNISINIDVLPPFTREESEHIANELMNLVKDICGGEVSYFILDKNKREIVFHTREESKVKPTLEIKERKAEKEKPPKKEEGLKGWTILDLMNRGIIEDIIVKEELLSVLQSGQKIKIYQGFDPTSPDLHIGHLISLRILRWFQIQGHHVIFLIGDATGLVGDPSGRSEKREMLTAGIIKKNMLTYKKQAGIILDFDDKINPVEILRNSKWLLNLTLKDMLPLMAKITAQRLLERDMFQERIKKGDPLFYVETIYPLLQGYDSVAMEVDAELGGRDQIFNMLVGRDLVKEYLGKSKHVVTTPLLPGLDGEKMSKTRANTVELTSSAFRMFDKIMQLRDPLINDYFILLTDVSWEDIERLREKATKDPLQAKERLAFEIVKMLHNKKTAELAHKEFIGVRREGKLPEKIDSAVLDCDKFKDKKISIVDLLTETTPSILPSRGEAKRMIRNRGVFFNNNRVNEIDLLLNTENINNKIVRIGKKTFYKIKIN